MITRITHLAAAMVFASGFTGCAPDEPGPARQSLTPGDESGEPLTLGSKQLVIDYEQDCGDNCERVDLTWPVVVTAPSAEVAENLNQSLREWYLGGSVNTPEELAEKILDKYRHEDYRGKWSFTRTWEIKSKQEPWWTLTLTDTTENFSSMPLIETRRIQVNALDGTRIDLSSYFSESAMDELNSRAEARFREQYYADYAEYGQRHGEKVEDFFELWRFKDNRFVVPPNFVVDTNGIVFHWNRYEIGPGAAGDQSLRLSWDEIADLLREDAPLPRSYSDAPP